MDILLILFIITLFILVICLIGLYVKSTNAICKSKKRLDGLTALITGGTSGMGLEIAIDFALRGARVIVACPFKNEGETAKTKIIEETGNQNVVYKFLDLASLESVRKFAANIIQTEDRLDILMNNAGVGTILGKTEDGMNLIMQVNYFGHFLLTILLLPLLKKTGTPTRPSRIVNTASVLHRTTNLNVNKMNALETNLFMKILVYGNSKLCLLLFSHELTKKLSGSNVIINSVDPGVVGTRIFGESGYMIGSACSNLAYFLSKTPYHGAQTMIHAAVDEDAGKVSGQFFRECSMQMPSSAARDDIMAKKVWDESIACVKLSQVELDECLKQ